MQNSRWDDDSQFTELYRDLGQVQIPLCWCECCEWWCCVLTVMAVWMLNLAGSRPYIFLSSRVHPGESNSSWVMKGQRSVGLWGDCDCVYLWVGWVCWRGGGGVNCFCELCITFALYARFAMIQTSSGWKFTSLHKSYLLKSWNICYIFFFFFFIIFLWQLLSLANWLSRVLNLMSWKS